MTLPDKELFEFDGFRLDAAEGLLLRDGAPVSLEPKVFETLLVLVRHGGRLVGKEELMQAVWPDTIVEESNLTRNISVLRKALQRDDGGTSYIETAPKRGYRFVGQLRPPPAEPVELPVELIVQSAKVSLVVEEEESDETLAAQPVVEALPPTAVDQYKRRKLAVALALLLAAMATAVYFSFFRRPAIDSLAVLPFVNAGANPDAEYLSDGITDGLINSLAQIPALKVMSRNSVFRYKGKDTDARQAGQALGVRAVLTGKVTQRGDDLFISAELVDVRDNSHLWGAQYNRKLSDLLAVQAELARDLAGKLRLRLSGVEQQRLTQRGTENAAAYELYLKGRYALSSLTFEGIKKSAEYFQRALEQDPRYGAAYAGLAEYYSTIAYSVTTSAVPPREAYAQGKAAALKAVQFDDTLAEAHNALAVIAMLQEWDWPAAGREFQRALALNPNYVEARHMYSHYLIYQGRFAESLLESERALALDPLDVGMAFHLGFHYYNARQYEQAVAQLQKALAMNRNHDDAHTILGLTYEQQGRHAEALAELQKSKEVGGADQRGNIGYLYAVSGQRDEARKLLAELLAEARRKYVSSYNLARIHTGLGEPEQAFAQLEKAYMGRDSNLTNVKVDPHFDRLHADARFADLLRRMGLAQ